MFSDARGDGALQYDKKKVERVVRALKRRHSIKKTKQGDGKSGGDCTIKERDEKKNGYSAPATVDAAKILKEDIPTY